MTPYADAPACDCRIFLRDIRLRCKIGIDAAEMEAPQLVRADIEILPSAPPDAGNPAVDYAAVLRRLREFAASKQHGLLEHFAGEIADVVLTEFAAAEVCARCEKVSPFADLGAAGAEIRKTRK